ncbi:MAG TPA: SRPBCC domain-containing protein [Candidatus Sulfotelmatobacter sp.]|nr:SRPBCC domain-containing protein [Candidatus Sulfotelmatobacter sp.]
MATTRITPDQDAVISEIDIAAPPERVFRALVERAQAVQWGSNPQFQVIAWEMDPRPGGKWRFVSRELTGKHPLGSEFEHHGEVLEIDPPRLLAITWIASWHADQNHRTVVRWELTATADGTHVKLTHSGLAQIPGACQGYSQGWPGLLQSLRAHCEK